MHCHVRTLGKSGNLLTGEVCSQSLQNMSRELEARGLPGRADLIWLLDCTADVSDAQLDAFAKYGYGIGPEKVYPTPLRLLIGPQKVLRAHCLKR